MDRPKIVRALLDRCKSLILNVLKDPSLSGVSSASLAIFEKFRDPPRTPAIPRPRSVGCRRNPPGRTILWAGLRLRLVTPDAPIDR